MSVQLLHRRPLHTTADWFEQCGVTLVAMKPSGVYWIPLYEVLERRGFDVLLACARVSEPQPS